MILYKKYRNTLIDQLRSDTSKTDRQELKTEGLEISKSKRLTNRDRKFICDNIDTIGHELAHALKGTEDNTKEHEEAQRQIRNKIMKGLF